MASISETGHAKNVANFESLILSVTGFGTAYNPSKETLKPAALQALYASAVGALGDVNAALSANASAVAARSEAFSPINKLFTRVGNAVKATDTTEQVDDSVQAILRKLKGIRATATLTDDEKKALEAEGKEVNQISTSQLSFDLRLENLDKLIKQLTAIPQYTPNEEELKVATLTALHTDLSTKNSAVKATEIQLSNARIARDQILYTPNNGLVYIAFDAKVYIKSIFDASSPQFKQVSKLKFKSIPK
ncbi:MAG: hypothetical protein PHV20_00255 [Bacteroidales bacterium]|nr:hypothetical protein [Bacteroidales bacterium]